MRHVPNFKQSTPINVGQTAPHIHLRRRNFPIATTRFKFLLGTTNQKASKTSQKSVSSRTFACLRRTPMPSGPIDCLNLSQIMTFALPITPSMASFAQLLAQSALSLQHNRKGEFILPVKFAPGFVRSGSRSDASTMPFFQVMDFSICLRGRSGRPSRHHTHSQPRCSTGRSGEVLTTQRLSRNP